jgi:hypothetical protein
VKSHNVFRFIVILVVANYCLEAGDDLNGSVWSWIHMAAACLFAAYLPFEAWRYSSPARPQRVVESLREGE